MAVDQRNIDQGQARTAVCSRKPEYTARAVTGRQNVCVLRSELVARPFISIEISKKALFCRPPLFRNEFREILIRAKAGAPARPPPRHAATLSPLQHCASHAAQGAAVAHRRRGAPAQQAPALAAKRARRARLRCAAAAARAAASITPSHRAALRAAQGSLRHEELEKPRSVIINAQAPH